MQDIEDLAVKNEECVAFWYLYGETEDIATAAGDRTEQWYALAGFRFAF